MEEKWNCMCAEVCKKCYNGSGCPYCEHYMLCEFCGYVDSEECMDCMYSKVKISNRYRRGMLRRRVASAAFR